MNCAGLCWLYRLLRGRVAVTTAGCSRQTRCVQNFPSRPVRAGQRSAECVFTRCELWRLSGGGARPSGGLQGFMAARALITALSLLAQGAVPTGRRGRIWKRLRPALVYRLLRGGTAAFRGGVRALWYRAREFMR